MKERRDRAPVIDLETKNTIARELLPILGEADQATDAARRARGRRWFGAGLILVAIFLAILCIFMAPGFYRSMFFGYSLLLVIVGAWQIDRA
jgi:uncharacterized membrane protein YdbT with pleckstrin-like domain